MQRGKARRYSAPSKISIPSQGVCLRGKRCQPILRQTRKYQYEFAVRNENCQELLVGWE